MEKAKLPRGMIQVYTGDGKGKTTAAFGVAMRAAGHGLKVYVVQFMKEMEYGEVKAAAAHARLITIRQCGRAGHVNLGQPDQIDKDLAANALALAGEIIAGGEYDLVILDEINLALGCGLLPIADVLAVLRAKPESVELILTGRQAPAELLEVADLVTEMREVKHYFRQGVLSRPGIDV
ncbi:MAG: cob(I)yrinic acid a,c-diamide adenosyltransferase [Dehalococcoidia bacterium]|nr:cob(I)yrinic acid a,c-diamide adenosyltransferase [Dehalococcoidia bacterium]